MSFLSRIALLQWISKRRLLWSGLALVGLGLLAFLVIAVTIRVREKPIETVAENSADESGEKPAENSTDKPADKPADKPGDKPADKPADKPGDKPADKPADKPGDKPADKPADKPPEPPAEVLPAFEVVVLEVRQPDKLPSVAEFQPLLVPVAASTPFKLTQIEGQQVKFQGLARIPGWAQGSLLRFENLGGGSARRIHLWGQKQGVTFCMYPQTNSVAAYRTLAEPVQTPVVCGALLATDDGWNARLPGGACHLSWHDGVVVFSRGNTQLLRVPLEGPIKAAYVESLDEMELRDLALLRSGPPAPADSPTEHRQIFDGSRPADLPWKENLPAGVRLLRRDDGSVELTAEKVPSIALATLPVTSPGLYSVTFQVEDATPGSGIVLLNAAGQPVDGVDYTRAPNSKVVFGPCSFDERRPVSYAGSGQWLRLIVAGGMSRCSVSGDGVHWGIVFDPITKIGAWRDIGLCLRPNILPEKPNDPPKPEDTPRRIRLCRLQIRELDGLTGAVSVELHRKAVAADVDFKLNETIDVWTTRIAGLAPAGCSPGEWRTACALQVLAGPVNVDTAAVLLDHAVAERLANLPTLQARLRLLQDASLINRNRPEDVAPLLEHWEQLGRAVLQAGTEAEFQQYQKARMETSGIGGGPMSASLTNGSLLLFYADHRWEELLRFKKRLISYPSVQVDTRLFDWMSQRTAGRASFTADLRQPLTVPVSRAAAGMFQNLQSALKDNQFQEAARLLTTSYTLRDDGLIATPTDEQLLVSYRGMQLILLHRRKLAEAMGGRLDAAAQLKVEQVLAQGDPAAVEALTVEYYGTTAHASACQWLGDRALAGSDFSRALSWFEEGRITASVEQQSDLAARVRLASAMLGYLRGEPTTLPVSFGSVKVSAEQFERRIREAVAKQQAKVETESIADAFPVFSDPQFVKFRFVPWGEFDGGGALGQLAAAASDDTLLLTNRKRAAAIDLASGKTRWSLDMGTSPALTPIYPLVAGQRIYLRSMIAPGRYGIVCLDKKTGRGLWRRDCGDEVAGDPQLFQGRLYVLAFGQLNGSAGMSQQPLLLVELDAESGEVLSRTHFAEASRGANSGAPTDKPSEYQSIWVGNRLIVVYSGSVLCLDLRGKVQWLRNSEGIPPDIDPTFPFQITQMPRTSGGRIYLQQPGNCAVQCLKAETGELVWRRGVIGLQRIVDINDNRILVQTTYGLTALRASKGEILWRRELPGMLSAVARNSVGQIFCARQIVQIDKSQLALLWIDAATGQTKAHRIIPLTYRDPLLLGPIVASGNRAWCCSNRAIEGDLKPGTSGVQIFALEPSGPAIQGEVP